MVTADAVRSSGAASRAGRVTTCDRRGGDLYPPKINAPSRMPGAVEYLRLLMKDPLLSLPPELYHQAVVFRRWPVPLAYVGAPNAVREVLVDRRDQFAEKSSIQRYILEPLLGNGILLAEGQDWRWQRQTTAPLFRYGEILNYGETMADAALRLVQTWRHTSGAIRMINRDMMQATYEVIARTMLIGGDKEISETILKEDSDYRAGFIWAVVYGLFRAPGWIPRPGRTAMRRRDMALRSIVGQMLDNGQDANPSTNDLLARLRDARHPETGQRMSREQLIDNVLTFLLAGHHTTAMALTWTLYLIACAPEWEARMLEEIERIVPEGPIRAEQVSELVVVQQVLKESMRLFPPVPSLSRVTTQDTHLGGHKIARGTAVNIPVYAVHRHRSVWQNPDLFDPTRFAKANESHFASCQFLPFGAGPRTCSGMAFAMIEATIFLATLVRAARFELVAEDFLPIPISRVVLAPRDGMPLKVTLRG